MNFGEKVSSDNDLFDRQYEVFLADTEASKNIHYNIRYQVYCDEMGYEDSSAFPDKLEFDEWDDHSAHFMVRHRQTGYWIGAVRLVHHRDCQFPFENWTQAEQKFSTNDYVSAVEMSRLCVLKDARKFAVKRFASFSDPIRHEHSADNKVTSLFEHRNQQRKIMWGLNRAAVMYAKQNNIKCWYILVAPALAAFIRKERFKLTQIGKPCDHRGLRTPYRLDMDDILVNRLWDHDYKLGYRLYSEVLEEQVPEKIRIAV